MGIYPVTKITDNKVDPDTGQETWIEHYNDFSGQTRHRKVTAEPWVYDERTTCYCCSCGHYSSDPSCRNHGFAGKRPCEEHNMPGFFDKDRGMHIMPDSVQVARSKNYNGTR